MSHVGIHGSGQGILNLWVNWFYLINNGSSMDEFLHTTSRKCNFNMEISISNLDSYKQNNIESNFAWYTSWRWRWWCVLIVLFMCTYQTINIRRQTRHTEMVTNYSWLRKCDNRNTISMVSSIFAYTNVYSMFTIFYADYGNLPILSLANYWRRHGSRLTTVANIKALV